MNRNAPRFGNLLGLVLFGTCATAGEPPGRSSMNERPDPATVERYGPAYRYPQAGWIVVHIEGEPYERGYQHGRLLAPEIADYVKALATKRSPKAAAEAWRDCRTLVNALFLRRYDKEYLEEMKGIADGAAAAGARFESRPIDLIDLVAVNSESEVDFIDDALHATPNGLEGRRFAAPDDASPRHPPADHCSAFAATGAATRDGKIVFGHITMWNLYMTRHFNVWLDIKPTRGHRILMQTFPGGIQSGMDYYLNDAGLLVAETTIAQTRFAIDGLALASRIRAVLQYTDSIDAAVAVLKSSNNGMYTNEWLLADTKTDEIAMFELGTGKSKLWRSSKDEWLGGTKGFYWGCNNTKDLAVRLETIPSVEGKPANLVFRPSDRDRTWIRLYGQHKGTIAAGFGFEAFTTPPLAAFSSCDAKFTTSAMAGALTTWARFGPPLGRTWDPSPAERERLADIRPLVGNDWTVLTADAPPPRTASAPAHDLASTKPSATNERAARAPTVPLPPAWRGTILPAADADLWLAAAFADYESIVARVRAIREAAKDRPLGEADEDRHALAMFAPRSHYLAAVARRGGDLPLARIKAELASNEWYAIASGKGVLLLAALHARLGDDAFFKLMDDFGRAHSGRPATTPQFREAVAAIPGQRAEPSFFDRWLEGEGLPDDPGGGFWSIDSYEEELDRALIVWGSLKEADAQHEAAGLLQRQIARRWSNATVPIRKDGDITDDELGSHHLLLVGRPDTNAVAARLARAVPVTFGPGSFRLRGRTYAHPASAVVAAGGNPLNPRREVVVFAGLGADATWRCVQAIGGRESAPAEVLLLASGAAPRRMVVSPAERARLASPHDRVQRDKTP